MKRLFLSLLAIMMAVAMNAHAKVAKADLADNQQIVGYYQSDKINNKGFGLPEWGENDHCRAAINLTADMLKPYVGKKIVRIRFGLSYKIDKSRVFVTKTSKGYEGEDVVSENVDAAEKGWNDITLANGYTIEEGQNLLVGFDFAQKTRKKGNYYAADCYPLSVVEEGITYMPILIYANRGYGDEWHEIGTQTGNLSIQAVVEGNVSECSAMAHDFNIVAAEPDKDTLAYIGFTNNGRKDINSIGYVVNIDGTETAEQTASLATAVAPGNDGTFTARIPATNSCGRKALKIEITKVNGNKNEAENNTANGQLGVAKEKYERNIVIEEFTTEECGNCPRVAEYLHTAMKKLNDKRVFAVAHHSAYGTDWLTQPCDEDMVATMFNGLTNAFAPAMAMNRRQDAIPESDATRRGCVFLPSSYMQIMAYANNQLSQTANSKLEMEVTPNVSGTMATVVVKGTCNDAYDIENSMLTLYMTEDSIKAKQQNGGSADYNHMHVIRYYNSTWGDKVTWNNDNTFTATFEIDIFPEWKKKDLQFVAFLNTRNDKDYADNVIDNAAGVNYSDATNGICTIACSQKASAVARFSANGMKVDSAVKGLNIIRLSDGRTVKTTVE